MSWGTALKAAEVVLGLTLLYFRFCLYETEEGHLENALVALWVRVSDYATSTRARFGRLLQETAQISTRLLDAVFGSKPISLRAIAVSGLLIFASFAAMLYGMEAYQHALFHPFSSIATVGAFLLAALAPVIVRRRWAASIPILAFLLFIGGFTALGTLDFGPQALFLMPAFVAPCFALDFLWLLAVRLGTKWASLHQGIWRHVVVILTSATVSLGVLLLLPYLEGKDTEFLESYNELPVYVKFAAETRLFVAAISAVQLVVLLIAFAHWVIWPVLSRVVYAAERYQLFRERKFFGTIGVALIVHASAGTWLATVIEPLWPKK